MTEKVLYTGITCKNEDYIHTPLIEIAPMESDKELCDAAEALIPEDILLFTSRYSAIYWHKAMLKRGKDWNGCKIISIGSTTSDKLRQLGASNILQCEKDDSYGVINTFKSIDNSHRIIFPRSNIALPIIPKGLKELGFQVKTMSAYRNIMPENPLIVDLKDIDKIIFTSPSTIDNFIRLYGYLPKDKKYQTRGVVTQNHLEKRLKEKYNEKI